MTVPEWPGEPPHPEERRPEAPRPTGALTRPGLLSRAARALAEAPDDADDAALLALLSPVVLPVLGDMLALYTVGTAGEARVVGASQTGTGAADRLRDHLERHPEAAAGYAETIAQGQARIVRAPETPASETDGRPGPLALLEGAGIAAELMAPLGTGARRDALLSIGSTDPLRHYDETDLSVVEVLAALVDGRRAIREFAQRETTLRQHLEAGAEAGRELAHLLNNDLTMPVGVVELLMDRGTLSSDLQEMLEAAANDLAALEQHVRDFHDVMRAQSRRSEVDAPPTADPDMSPP